MDNSLGGNSQLTPRAKSLSLRGRLIRDGDFDSPGRIRLVGRPVKIDGRLVRCRASAAEPELERPVERRQALPDGIASCNVKAALQILDFAAVVLRGDFGLLEGPLQGLVPVPEVFDYSVALLDGEAVLYPAPFPLELLGKGIWLYNPMLASHLILRPSMARPHTFFPLVSRSRVLRSASVTSPIRSMMNISS